MFTGIIEERNTIKDIKYQSGTAQITIKSEKIIEGVKIGDSIAVNGICLTVTKTSNDAFCADISEETLRVTTAKYFKKGTIINLERALKLGDRLSGHIVTGHIDTIGKIKERINQRDFSIFHIEIENEKYMKYVIQKGSIAIDGISLTVNEIKDKIIRLNIIPHTLKNTNLEFLKVGDLVNVEFDIIGKYIERLLGYKNNEAHLTEEFILKAGFSGGFLK